MKKTALLFIYCALFSSTYASVLITGFGKGEFKVTTVEKGALSQDSTGCSLTGSDSGTMFWGDLGNLVDISGNTSFLLLVGTLSGAIPESRFQINLADSQGAEAFYEAEFAAFELGETSMVKLALLSMDDAFNNRVQSLGFLTGGSGTGFELTVDSLHAVPEPSSAALVGVVVLGAALQSRRS